MCKIIKTENITAIICGGKSDHECNENAQTYEDRDGKRYYFNNRSEGDKWYDENYKDVLMASVACSICGGTAIDNAWRLPF